MDMNGSTRGKNRPRILLAIAKSQTQYGASNLRLLFASPFTALAAGDDGSQTYEGLADDNSQAAHGFVAKIIHKKLLVLWSQQSAISHFPVPLPHW